MTRWSDQRLKVAKSRAGMPSASAMIVTGNGTAKSRTRSNAPRRASAVSRRSVGCSTRGRSVSIDRGVKALDTSLRSRV
jgi:hypothetical protein